MIVGIMIGVAIGIIVGFGFCALLAAGRDNNE